jgi:hypothetical protein
MIVSAWYGGGGYGLRILEGDVSLYFRPEWTQISLELPDEREPVTISLTESFWSTAPELRSSKIKAFLERNSLIPWEKNKPPHFELEPLGKAAFRLRLLEKVRGQTALPLEV